MDVVVVESPSKAKTINKYLGEGYKVLASYGHIRDLPAKDGSVRPDADFAMDWAVDPKAEKHVREIARALKGASHLYLATDPDREGEAISWHVLQVLADQHALNGVDVKRVVFNEITKSAVQNAFKNPRDLDKELIDAYLARRALDYLVGFTLSPVLWRKLPGSRSAGRVQSVALRLICEREAEIENFRVQEYWTVKGTFRTPTGDTAVAELTHLDGQKLEKFSLPDEAAAKRAVAAVEAASFRVAKVERKQARRHPPPPFLTSTLQQEAARKLYFGAKRTMQVAQRLYEGMPIDGETVGLITYMRTDGVTMAAEAVSACRDFIGRELGRPYLPEAPRVYKSRVKNAQEAHEAIRPTDISRRPQDLPADIEPDQRRLYELIWKRTLASQMESAVLDQVAADIESPDGKTILRATGSVIAFDGFLKLYQEGRDDTEGEEEEKRLPNLTEGTALERTKVEPEKHATQPPPRYSEASLVKTLEELGIGRPSTYASIISVLQDRKYVRLDKRRFIPEDRGRLVTAFLTSFFKRYVEYGFTADLENKLDDISGGRIDWKAVLRDFWSTFSQAVDETKDLRVREVLDALDELLGPHFFRESESGANPRKCPACAAGRLNLKLGKFGAFIGCSTYPECRYTRPLEVSNGEGSAADVQTSTGPKLLGTDPETGLPVTLRKGPYGHYVQRGEAGEDKEKKPKRASVLKGTDLDSIDLERALALLTLPRNLGPHPETKEPITAAVGRFGPYIHHDGNYVSLKGDDDVLTIGLNRAVALLADSPRKAPLRTVGAHPTDGKSITVRRGRFGPYLQHGAARAPLPKGTSVETLTIEEAVTLLQPKALKAKPKKPRAKRVKKVKESPEQPKGE